MGHPVFILLGKSLADLEEDDLDLVYLKVSCGGFARAVEILL